MDPENDVIEGQGSGPGEDTTPWSSDPLDLLIGDSYDEPVDESTEGGPAAGDAAPEPEGDDTDATTDAGDTATEADDPRAADLPDDLKEILKTIPRSRRGAFIDHFEGKAETKLKAAQEIEAANKRDADAREAKATEIRNQRGTYIGKVEGKREDGTPIPTYEEIERLLKADDGEDVLDDKYGLSLSEARAQLRSWDKAREMLDGSLDDFRTEAWVEGGRKLATSVAAAGLPIDAIWKDVQGIDDVVPSVVKHLTAKHQAELDAQKKEFDGRLKAANANAPAVAARTAAKTLPSPETGGRGDAGGSRVYRESELEDLAFFKANEADIDRAYAEGRIVPG